MDREVSSELVGAVYRRTDGNALFVLEVIRLLTQEPELLEHDDLQEDAWLAKIPGMIRAVISKRLNRLSQSCNQVLIAAAVLGREFGLNELEHIFEELPAGDVSEAVDEALRVSLIEEVAGSADRCRFTHALIQDAIASQLSTAKRKRMHNLIGSALEKLYETDIDDHVVELAHHFSESGTAAGAAKMVHYLTAAGEKALAIYAIEEAAAHFARALAAKETRPPDSETASIFENRSRPLCCPQQHDRDLITPDVAAVVYSEFSLLPTYDLNFHRSQ